MLTKRYLLVGEVSVNDFTIMALVASSHDAYASVMLPAHG